jgi:Tol biopolymer transport system component
MKKSLLLVLLCVFSAAASDSSVARWSADVNIHPLTTIPNRHTIHTYFNTCPESPDGKYVIFYVSTTEEGHTGEIHLLERATGKEETLAAGISTEDAHRAACQQWCNEGKTVAYHDCRNGQWVVVAIDLATHKERILARDHQLGIGSPHEKSVPLYGCHWKPGEFRDLYLVDVETAEIRTIVKCEEARAAYGDWIKKTFGEKDVSLFFPVLSPNGKRVFFKIACGNGGDDFRSKNASKREGKFVYDLETKKMLRMYVEWGHPSWHPDSKQVFEKGNTLYDPDAGTSKQFVLTPTDHPSISPDGKLFVSDADVSKRDFAKLGDWCIAVGSTESQDSTIVYRFNNTHGATSWRKNHPHPSFSPDGNRIYFNVNSGPWTTLYVAEAKN